jgi:DNA-binding transcriptional ArsR family regulator
LQEQTSSELLVYWVVLEKGPVGLRDVQRLVGFSSPSTAVYHLDRLKTRGLVDKNAEGKYYAVTTNRPGVLRFYILIGRHLVPKSLIYGIILPIIGVAALHLANYRYEIALALIPAFLAAAIFWYETYDLFKYKRDLFKKRSNLRMDDSKP